MINAGRVAIVPQGQFDATKQYTRLDFVNYDGKSYIAKTSNIPVGTLPTNEEFFMLAIDNTFENLYLNQYSHTSDPAVIGYFGNDKNQPIYRKWFGKTISINSSVIERVLEFEEFNIFTPTILAMNTVVTSFDFGSTHGRFSENTSELKVFNDSGEELFLGKIIADSSSYSSIKIRIKIIKNNLTQADGTNAFSVEGYIDFVGLIL